MKTYYISITETRNRVVAIDAEDVDAAIKLAEHMHYVGGLNLTENDYVGSEFADETDGVETLINDGVVDKSVYELPVVTSETETEN